jgi:hypothetical protein
MGRASTLPLLADERRDLARALNGLKDGVHGGEAFAGNEHGLQLKDAGRFLNREPTQGTSPSLDLRDVALGGSQPLGNLSLLELEAQAALAEELADSLNI